MAVPDVVFTKVIAPDDNAFELVSAAEVQRVKATHIYIIERAGFDALFSTDGGLSFSELPASTGVALDGLNITGAVQGKNGTPGSDVSLSGRLW